MKKSSKKFYEREITKAEFCEFLQEPVISLALLVFALVALLFSVMEFYQALNY